MGLLVLISPLLWTYHMGFHWIRLRRWQWIYNVGPIASINMEISWLVVFILRIPIWLDHMPYFKFIFSIANIWLLFFCFNQLITSCASILLSCMSWFGTNACWFSEIKYGTITFILFTKVNWSILWYLSRLVCFCYECNECFLHFS